MCVQEVNGLTARCQAKGVERTVSLFMLQHEPVAAGDMVMVHLGHAIQKVAPEQASAVWELYDRILGDGGCAGAEAAA
jgi:hydrogenase expression/formation protein HypC